ncbi:MAG: terpene cyclase/mutase family protein [Phycisphaeraceae bacterium]|nr:terpene cyclase/mutase family protein [Phycisphaeraceae bacterium]MCW5761632.1 terpene cyclase/mutase family protein [Phycisphaeraceae bacterium]
MKCGALRWTQACSVCALAGLAMAQDATNGSGQPEVRERQSAANVAAADEMTPAMDRAVERGLAYLASQQQPDGSFAGGRFGRNVAITALCSLAFMADGHVPGRGIYGDVIDRGVDFIVANSAENGLIAAEAANGPMYGHGFAALFLGEVYGMTQGGGDTARAARVHEALVKSVRLIERTQNDEGGWRYNPVPYDADVSVTICQIMALRSARNAGIEVSKDVIDKAVEYVRRCQNRDGGFRYQTDLGPSAWPRSAAGIASLFYAGIYTDQAIDAGLAYLRDNASPGDARVSRAHYFYGHYYAVQAMYLAGGQDWSAWWPAIRTELLDTQLSDGSWVDRSVGSSYGTSMALIILQMPKRYLPIFQK